MLFHEWHCNIYILLYYISYVYYTVKPTYELDQIEELLFKDGKDKFKEHDYNGDS